MRYPRLFGTLVLGSGLAWLASPPSTWAQPPVGVRDAFRKDAKRPSAEVFSLITQLKDGTVEINGPDKAKNLDTLRQMAEFLVTPVTHRELYSPTIERKSQDGKKVLDLSQADRDKTLDGVLSELDRYVLVPDVRSKAPTNQADYVQEFGKALDAVITSILKDTSNAPPPLKLNAVRALAVACKSGAKVHAKTVLNLLTDNSQPYYLKLHALKAAENLFAAGDLLELQGANPYRHSIPDKDLADLTNAIEAMIVDLNKAFEPPPPPAPAPSKPVTPPAAAGTPPAKPDDGAQKLESKFTPVLDPDVALYFRKQAVKTLSKVRVAAVPGANKTMAAYPGVVLARVAAGDPWFTGGGTAAELADAVTGLANLHLDGTTSVDVLLDAMAAGVSSFGGAKSAANVPGEKDQPEYKRTVAWKKTAAQLSAAMTALTRSADKNPIALANRTAIGGLTSACTTFVLTPIEVEKEGDTTKPVNTLPVDDFRKQNPRKGDLLIVNDPKSKITLPNQRPGR